LSTEAADRSDLSSAEIITATVTLLDERGLGRFSIARRANFSTGNGANYP